MATTALDKFRTLKCEEDEEEKRQRDARTAMFQNACSIWFSPPEERISRELRQLPQKEREKVWADLSGNEKTSNFRKNIVEDPDAIAEALDAMRHGIEDIQDKSALELARSVSPEYINSLSFQKKFLRSCEYDGLKAAKKLVEHMETKRRLFGDELLGRDINLSDLSVSDMNCLKSGGVQFLPDRDKAGRMILYGDVEQLRYKEQINLSRVLFYCLMTALEEDEEVQKHGIVVIWNLMSEYRGGYDYEVDRLAIQTASALPIRFAARYVIYESVVWKQVIDVLNHLIPSHLRVRTRNIQGTCDEVKYKLMCCGIPGEAIPITSTQDEKVDLLRNHKSWISCRQKKESCTRMMPSLTTMFEVSNKRQKLA